MQSSNQKWLILITSAGIFIALTLIIIAFLNANTAYYYSIQELNTNPDLQNQQIRITGAVLGNSIQTDPQTGQISFLAAHIPVDQKQIKQQGGIEQILHDATLNPHLPQIAINYIGIRPELLVNEAQVIANGYLDQNNQFIAQELLLKCPSKYEERIPLQTGTAP